MLLYHPKIDYTKVEFNWRYSLFMLSCERGDLELVSFLLKENKIDINDYNREGDTALMLSCKNGHIEVVDLLLSNRNDSLDVNKKNKKG